MATPNKPSATDSKSDRGKIEESRLDLHESQIDFTKEALNEVMVFLKNDNRVVETYADIMEILKEDLKRNPSNFYAMTSAGNKDDAGGIVGSNWFTDLIGAHVEVILADKELAWKMIDKLIPW